MVNGAAGSAQMPVTSPMQSGAAGTGAPTTVGTGAAGAAGSGSGKGIAGSGAAAGASGAAGTSATVSAGTLKIDFTTVNQHGTYAPANVGAVWIETSGGMFVRTLERWGTIRAYHLTRWTMASGGWNSFFGVGANADEMDAVSGATMQSHQMHHETWDLKDLKKQLVPDGKYKVWIECTEDNFAAGASAGVEFEKGPAAQSVKPPDMPPWAGLTITYQP
jgi:hypothetical protein